MFPYWFLFTLCAAGAVQFRDRPNARGHGGPLLLFMILLTTAMIGLRYEVGGDWFNYVHIFQDIRYEPIGDILTMSDPGYGVLNWIIGWLGMDLWMVNLICAAIFMWGLAKFVRRQPNPWLALLVGIPYLIIVVAMGYTRQAVAIGIILAGLSSPAGRRITRFWIYVAFAATFHRTAIIVLPLVAISQTRNRWLMVVIGAAALLMLYYLFVSAEIDLLMTNYVEQQYGSEGAGIRVAMNLVPAAVFLRYSKRFGLHHDELMLWRNFALAAFAALALLFLSPSSTVVDRLALYLIPLQLIVFARLPMVFGTYGRRNGQLTIAIIAYSALVQFVWLTNADNADYWLPYKVYPL
jgi:hypothetical protein